MAKFGAFKYFPLRTPFNPQMAEQHIFEMIPSLSSNNRGRRRSSIVKSDLTLKIVKTADNNLSVVKKDQLQKELPQIKRTIDITGDETVSRTPTPPPTILQPKTAFEIRSKRSKSINRSSYGSKILASEKKSHEVLRRKSMAIDKMDQKTVSVVNYKRKSLHVPSYNDEIKTPKVVLTRSDQTANKEIISNTTDGAVENTKLSSRINQPPRKRKVSNEQPEGCEMVLKTAKLDENRSQSKRTIEPNTSTEIYEQLENPTILSSVGLVKKDSTNEKSRHQNLNTKAIENDLLEAKKSNLRNNRTATITFECDDKTNDLDSLLLEEKSSSIMLVPFIEIKEEPKETESSPKESFTESSEILRPTTNKSTISSNNVTNINYKDSDMPSNVCIEGLKMETSSDDDFVASKRDRFSTMGKKPNNSSPSIAKLIDNIRRGGISVRDINKLTNTGPSLKSSLNEIPPKARKSFPTSSGNLPISLLRSRNGAAINKQTTNNMVCIPLDGNGMPSLDLGLNSSQPPPLTMVSSNVSSFLQGTRSSLPATVSNTQSSCPTTLSSSSSEVSGRNFAVTQALAPVTLNSKNSGADESTSDINIREPPKLVSRPAAPLRSETNDIVLSSALGSVSKVLTENSYKMADFFRSVIEDTLSDLANTACPIAKIRLLEMELEKQNLKHETEIVELKANTDRLLNELKTSMEKERLRAVNEVRKQCEIERIRSVDEAKKKQWCTNCGKEAL